MKSRMFTFFSACFVLLSLCVPSPICAAPVNVVVVRGTVQSNVEDCTICRLSAMTHGCFITLQTGGDSFKLHIDAAVTGDCLSLGTGDCFQATGEIGEFLKTNSPVSSYALETSMWSSLPSWACE